MRLRAAAVVPPMMLTGGTDNIYGEITVALRCVAARIGPKVVAINNVAAATGEHNSGGAEAVDNESAHGVSPAGNLQAEGR